MWDAKRYDPSAPQKRLARIEKGAQSLKGAAMLECMTPSVSWDRGGVE
jgi:hypothetical protein